MVDLNTRHESEASFYDSLYGADFSAAELIVKASEPPAFSCGMEALVKELLAHMQPLKGKRILDLGCGGGLFSTYFAQNGARVTGVDVSGGALSVARRRAELSIPSPDERPRFLQVPSEAISQEFPAKSFDVVFAFTAAHHFDQPQFPGHVDHVLDDGGMLALYEPVTHSAALQRLRMSRAALAVWPVAVHTEYEQPFLRETIDALSMRFNVREYPRRTLIMAALEGHLHRKPPLGRLFNRLLGGLETDPRWPDGGCAAAHRLTRADSIAIEKVPLLRMLCRTSIIVAQKPPASAASPASSGAR
jgi:SAM-dependent methyltransferase